MSALTTRDDVSTIPKVELHVHFGGNLAPAVALELAQRHGVDPSTLPIVDGRYPAVYDGFSEFLGALIAVNDLIRNADDVERVAAAIALEQARQNVIHTELIVTAVGHVRSGIPARDFWSALRSGLSAAGRSTRFTLIIDAIRNDGPRELTDVFRLIDDADAPIVGVGLTGVEETWPVEDFAFIRRFADDRALGVEVHAGEMGPPSSIVASLDVLGADRIGHGVAAAYDDDVLARLVREQVHLEVCPSSNLRIGLFPTIEAHPVQRFWEAGVNMSINSDDPPLMRTTLCDELCLVADAAGMSRADLVELQRRAARAAFISEQDRADLLVQIDAWEQERRAT